jgi:hypothetical protein
MFSSKSSNYLMNGANEGYKANKKLASISVKNMANPSDNADAPDMPLSSLSALPTTQPITNNKLPISSNVMTQKNVDVDTFLSKISDADSYLQHIYLDRFGQNQTNMINNVIWKTRPPRLEGGAESSTHKSRNRQTLKRPSTTTSPKPIGVVVDNNRTFTFMSSERHPTWRILLNGH